MNFAFGYKISKTCVFWFDGIDNEEIAAISAGGGLRGLC